MTDWERGVLAALLSIDGPPDGPDGRVLRESLPHLVVTGGCDCGCPSFFVRDARQPPDEDSDGHFHYSNAATPDRSRRDVSPRQERPSVERGRGTAAQHRRRSA